MTSGKPRSFALFDLDFTLIGHDTLLLFCNYILKKHPWRILYLIFFAPVAVLAAPGWISSGTLKRFFLSFLWGLPREKLVFYARDFVQRSVLPRMYPELLSILREHQEAGRTVVLNTAAPDIYAPYIADALKVEHVYSTRILLKNRMPLLPVMEGRNNKNLEKIHRMQEILPEAVGAALKEKLDWKRPEYPPSAVLRGSFSYSDSPADLPLLRLTEFAAVVNPESSAYIEEARKKGWDFLYPARDFRGRGGKVWLMFRQCLGLYPVEPLGLK
ncbi:MAG: haloacid dehalogenase-like hydrolase [Leptospiraceae bacterium]|nr:haloacid dehalogenase-like hydrolase [Leptospiraceae bacterium]